MRWMLIIPNYSREEKDLRMLARCLRSIQDHEPHLLSRTLIVDDASPYPDINERLTGMAESFQVSCFFREINGGYSKTVNDGLRAAMEDNCDVALTINSDVECLTPFRKTVELVMQHPMVRVVGGRLLFPSGKIQSAGFEVEDNGIPLEYFKNELPLDRGHPSHSARFAMGVTGAFQAIRLPCELYDEAFPMGYEDVEFCLRMWAMGGRVFYTPAIEVIHSESASRGHFPGERELRSVERFHHMMATKYDVARIRNQIASINQSFLEG